MGVFSISATLEARNLGRAYLAQQLSQREAPRVNIIPDWDWGPASGVSFDLRSTDVEILRRRLAGWQAISATRWGSWNGTILFEGQEAPANLEPVSLDHLATSGRRLTAGRFFTPSDFEKYRAVAVIDTWLEDELFGETVGVGKRIHAENNSYLVIGVVESLQDGWGQEPRGVVMVSMAIDTALTGRDTIDRILIRPRDVDNLEAIGEQAVQLLEQQHPGQEFYSWTNIQDIDFQKQVLRTVSIVLLVLGGIALTVGGVGIANITIASTIERTSEIGLRRAIGATQQEILVQFVLEAVIISCLGGMAAIASTQGITLLVAGAFDLPHSVNVRTSMMALGSAVVVGIGSSFVPALQASRLDPVNALRA